MKGQSRARRPGDWRDFDPVDGDYKDYDDYDDFSSQNQKIPDAPEFPVSAMPEGCRRLITEGAASIGCPPEFVGVPMLAALASAIGNSRCVEIKPGWEEKAVIFATTIGDPASKKTPAAKIATRPAKILQVEMRNDYRAKHDEHKREMRQHEVDKKSLARDGVAGPEPPQSPVMERSVVDDTTTEALIRILGESPRGVLVAKDELAGWMRSMDQYKAGGKGSDRQAWLSLWNSDSITVDRKGEPEALMVPEPCVSLSGGVQPEVLKDLSRGPEDGMLDRFLCAFPEPVAPGWHDAHISEQAQSRYANLYRQLRIRHMHTDEQGDPEPTRLYFSESAKAVLIDAINAHAAEVRRPGFPTRLKGVYGKLEGYVGRLCLVLALARSVEDKAPERVEAQDVVAAVSLVGYFKAMARRVYGTIHDANPLDSLAEDLARLLEENGGEWSGEPSELYLQIKTAHKPGRVNEFSKLIRKAADRERRIILDENTENFTKPDGARSTRRVLRISLLESS